MLKLVSKTKAIQLIFITQKITFNREKILNILNSSNIIEIKVIIIEKPKIGKKK